MKFYAISDEELALIDSVRKRLYTEIRMDGDQMRDAAHLLTKVVDVAKSTPIDTEAICA